MKKYEQPEVQFEEFIVADILTASSDPTTDPTDPTDPGIEDMLPLG